MGLLNFWNNVFGKSDSGNSAEDDSAFPQETTEIHSPSIFQISAKIPEASQSRNLQCSEEIPFKIHEDLMGLLWFADGPMQNYDPEEDAQKMSAGPISISLHATGEDEPSAIYTGLQIVNAENKTSIPSPGYFPEYKRLTPEQRGVYLDYLRDPYQNDYDISYVFLLYYGLERHLLLGDYYHARNIILKLRELYSYESFQIYSTNSLFLCAAIRGDDDFIKQFVFSDNLKNLWYLSKGMFLRYCYCQDISLTARQIMLISGAFGFSNRLYIDKYPDMFKEQLKEIMTRKFGSTEFCLKNILNDDDFFNMPDETGTFFANTSIRKCNVHVPDVLKSGILSETLLTILEQTHAELKIKVASMRKAGTLPKSAVEEKPKTPKKSKDKPVFDEKIEKKLLKDLEKAVKANNFIAMHDLYDELIRFYYSYRDLDDKYVDVCASYCRKQITNLPAMEQMFIGKQIKEERHFRKIEGERIFREQLERIHNDGYLGRVEGFHRLTMIHKKRKEFDDALRICDEAIAWKPRYADEWRREKEKIILRKKSDSAKKMKSGG